MYIMSFLFSGLGGCLVMLLTYIFVNYSPFKNNLKLLYSSHLPENGVLIGQYSDCLYNLITNATKLEY